MHTHHSCLAVDLERLDRVQDELAIERRHHVVFQLQKTKTASDHIQKERKKKKRGRRRKRKRED